MISGCGESETGAGLRAADVSNLIPVKGEERKAKAPAETGRRQ